jgi:hypothetical protein
MDNKQINFYINLVMLWVITYFLFDSTFYFLNHEQDGFSLLSTLLILPVGLTLFYPFNYIEVFTKFKFSFGNISDSDSHKHYCSVDTEEDMTLIIAGITLNSVL